ncbi:MAG: methylated-DNA--[protein]-cysteine S-methyltransferase [Burkholderiales bacterium]|nr:methylated-DNA--[protein]-cysteine S-methyltransferase [Burkholderiales bacterium]
MKPEPLAAVFSAIIPAPFGAMGIRTEAQQVRELVYLPPSFARAPPQDAFSQRVAEQVTAYFNDPDFVFDLPVRAAGTDFQRRVWTAISSVPRGEVRTYGQIAKAVQSAPRAVGQACGANWVPLIIPCHRVTASGGLGGFAHHADNEGFHLNVKRWLLKHEQVAGY